MCGGGYRGHSERLPLGVIAGIGILVFNLINKLADKRAIRPRYGELDLGLGFVIRDQLVGQGNFTPC